MCEKRPTINTFIYSQQKLGDEIHTRKCWHTSISLSKRFNGNSNIIMYLYQIVKPMK